MTTRSRRIRSLEFCDPNIFGDIVVMKQTGSLRSLGNPRVRSAIWTRVRTPPPIFPDDDPKEYEKRRASVLLDQLLLEIYSNLHTGYSDYNSATSTKSQKAYREDLGRLKKTGIQELRSMIGGLESHVVRFGSILVRQLKRRDALRRQRDARYDVISYLLRKRLPEFCPEMRFSIEPLPGDSGFSQWHSAMKMVSQLPEGIPPEFRRRLWLSLADKHLTSKGIDWHRVEKNCFSEWSHPADAELGVQIVKDLHRTGCSLFCGKDGQENQALLKRVLLAYARWNKAVGYCQGFNMLAALILQVTEKSETDALKLMIYLIEGVLPDSYFADSLRGLSVDMAVFRELLRTKLPRLSKHLDTMQVASKEGTTSYEPPLTNVFTMQWFLTLFCNCLPQPTVLRVWDLILLEGNEILLRTALAIWQVLADKIMAVKSADEFYCVMGMLMREILEFDLIDANTLVKGIVTIGPLPELGTLREHYLYNITPWGSSVPASESDRRMKVYHKDRLVLDIGVLKKQYTKLKQRQRQAHIIFNTAVARQTARPAPVAMNHLLLGKSALVPAKRLGPPKGTIPPARQQQPTQPTQSPQPPPPPKTLHWKDTRRNSSSSSSSSDTELCDEPDAPSDDDEDPKCQLPDDNLKEPSDKTLMTVTTEDNTPKISASASDGSTDLNLMDLETKLDPPQVPDDNQIELKSDIFDTETSTSDLYDLNKLTIQRSDSVASEDGFDFEKFLEERVKSFTEKTYSSEESIEDNSEQERLKYARRNSVRALEIIQENSLILHRILQCQSRMTPTPPPIDDDLQIPNFLEIEPGMPVLIPDEEATPTNEFATSCEPHRDELYYSQLIDSEHTIPERIDIEDTSTEITTSASMDDIMSKYSMISKEITEVDYNLEKYRQKLGSPVIEEISNSVKLQPPCDVMDEPLKVTVDDQLKQLSYSGEFTKVSGEIVVSPLEHISPAGDLFRIGDSPETNRQMLPVGVSIKTLYDDLDDRKTAITDKALKSPQFTQIENSDSCKQSPLPAKLTEMKDFDTSPISSTGDSIKTDQTVKSGKVMEVYESPATYNQSPQTGDVIQVVGKSSSAVGQDAMTEPKLTSPTSEHMQAKQHLHLENVQREKKHLENYRKMHGSSVQDDLPKEKGPPIEVQTYNNIPVESSKETQALSNNISRTVITSASQIDSESFQDEATNKTSPLDDRGTKNIEVELSNDLPMIHEDLPTVAKNVSPSTKDRTDFEEIQSNLRKDYRQLLENASALWAENQSNLDGVRDKMSSTASKDNNRSNFDCIGETEIYTNSTQEETQIKTFGIKEGPADESADTTQVSPSKDVLTNLPSSNNVIESAAEQRCLEDVMAVSPPPDDKTNIETSIGFTHTTEVNYYKHVPKPHWSHREVSPSEGYPLAKTESLASEDKISTENYNFDKTELLTFEEFLITTEDYEDDFKYFSKDDEHKPETSRAEFISGGGLSTSKSDDFTQPGTSMGVQHCEYTCVTERSNLEDGNVEKTKYSSKDDFIATDTYKRDLDVISNQSMMTSKYNDNPEENEFSRNYYDQERNLSTTSESKVSDDDRETCVSSTIQESARGEDLSKMLLLKIEKSLANDCCDSPRKFETEEKYKHKYSFESLKPVNENIDASDETGAKIESSKMIETTKEISSSINIPQQVSPVASPANSEPQKLSSFDSDAQGSKNLAQLENSVKTPEGIARVSKDVALLLEDKICRSVLNDFMTQKYKSDAKRRAASSPVNEETTNSVGDPALGTIRVGDSFTPKTQIAEDLKSKYRHEGDALEPKPEEQLKVSVLNSDVYDYRSKESFEDSISDICKRICDEAKGRSGLASSVDKDYTAIEDRNDVIIKSEFGYDPLNKSDTSLKDISDEDFVQDSKLQEFKTEETFVSRSDLSLPLFSKHGDGVAPKADEEKPSFISRSDTTMKTLISKLDEYAEKYGDEGAASYQPSFDRDDTYKSPVHYKRVEDVVKYKPIAYTKKDVDELIAKRDEDVSTASPKHFLLPEISKAELHDENIPTSRTNEEIQKCKHIEEKYEFESLTSPVKSPKETIYRRLSLPKVVEEQEKDEFAPAKSSENRLGLEERKSSDENMIEIGKNSKYNSILEYSRNLDEKFNSLILKAPGPNLKFSYSLDSGAASYEKSGSSSPNLLKSPGASPKSPLRSPSHSYNPFPVNISSRQNKDVAVRLGLYKK